MHNTYNPFKANRTEQMKELWKYYVPFSKLDNTCKPIVVEGGRGSGKTMFFQCNSWRQILSKLSNEEKPLSDILNEEGFIGIYYRVDTSFVSAMCNEDDVKWHKLFETYFSICILQDILLFLKEIKPYVNIDLKQEVLFYYNISKRFDPKTPVSDFEDFYDETNRYLDCIEDVINGIETRPQIRYVTAHRIINDICVSLSLLLKSQLLFKIFIDEYETLQEYQQKIINTLIKHSALPVVYNIGLRPHGMKTSQTISQTETIEAPHDFEEIVLGIGNSNEISYSDIVKQICKKRIQTGKEEGKIPLKAEESIEYYLSNYSIEEEITRINTFPHKTKLRNLIQERGKEEGLSEAEINQCIISLCDETSPLNSRIHYALLCKRTSYTPKILDLFHECLNNSNRYSDWLHNRKNGAIYLLCKEAKRDKMYFGFDAFLALSSNIVRYFLELCEQAFSVAINNNFNWDRPITPEEQTIAARYVSEYKIIDIAGYEPYGKNLRIFVQYLGKIFYKLHIDETSTLGEPEPNHFFTKDLSLSEQEKKLISSAIMWNVLQEGEPTKRKISKLSPETVDYYINRIYAPYFGISYMNQRKILINIDVLRKLMSGSESEAKKGFQAFFKEKMGEDGSEEMKWQMSLFEIPQGGNV